MYTNKKEFIFSEIASTLIKEKDNILYIQYET